MSTLSDTAIIGAYEHPKRRIRDMSSIQIAAESAVRALADAGIPATEVDGVFCTGLVSPGGRQSTQYFDGAMSAMQLSDYLGIKPRYVDSTRTGGASWLTFAGRAAAAISSGACSVALLAYGSTARSDGWAIGTGAVAEPNAYGIDQFLLPYGSVLVANYALVAHRHMWEFGTTSEQLASIAVTFRQHASLNPQALLREPITVDDVIASPMVCDPLHVYDCCVITDGGGAVVLTSAERARSAAGVPIYILGYGEHLSHGLYLPGMANFTSGPAAISGKAAFDSAGLEPSDIDVLQLYDSFTITVLMTLEDLGFCEKGDGGRFVEGNRLRIDGDLPTNTDGGGLCSNHPGMRGLFAIIEAVLQLRAQCGGRQVEGARIALVHGTGGLFSTGATLILGGPS